MHFHRFHQTLYPSVQAGNIELATTIRSLLQAAGAISGKELSEADLPCCLDPHLFAGFTSGHLEFCPAQTLLDTVEERAACRHCLPTRECRPIPVMGKAHPVVAAALRHSAGLPAHEPEPVEPARYMPHIEQAWSLIQSAQPGLFRLLESTVQHVLLFRSARLNSFASLSLHGLVGLNIEHGSSLTFFVDDLCHQGGHVIFNALTSNTARYLNVDAEAPLCLCVDAPDDPRTVYSAFHGLYTYTCILGTLAELYGGGQLTPLHRSVALARVLFYLDKFALDLSLLSDPALFTADGRALYDTLCTGQRILAKQFSSAVGSIDLAGQPYVFSESVLLARNPQLIHDTLESPSINQQCKTGQAATGGSL